MMDYDMIKRNENFFLVHFNIPKNYFQFDHANRSAFPLPPASGGKGGAAEIPPPAWSAQPGGQHINPHTGRQADLPPPVWDGQHSNRKRAASETSAAWKESEP